MSSGCSFNQQNCTFRSEITSRRDRTPDEGPDGVSEDKSYDEALLVKVDQLTLDVVLVVLRRVQSSLSGAVCVLLVRVQVPPPVTSWLTSTFSLSLPRGLPWKRRWCRPYAEDQGVEADSEASSHAAPP